MKQSGMKIAPVFEEPDVDETDDEDGFSWDFDRGGPLGNYDEDD